MDQPQALALFDIDGTLVRGAGPHHRQALEAAVWRVLRVRTSTESVPVAGMLDCDILTIMMTQAGVPRASIRSAMPGIVRRAQWIYARTCPDLTDKACPGVAAALERVARRGILMGLVTGNLTRIGWKKLERAGLKTFFRFGAFAELARDRAGLVRIARAEARRRGWIGRGAQVSLIGDHPNDVKAARANRIRAIAVATGPASYQELASQQPDVVLPDLRALDVEMLL